MGSGSSKKNRQQVNQTPSPDISLSCTPPLSPVVFPDSQRSTNLLFHYARPPYETSYSSTQAISRTSWARPISRETQSIDSRDDNYDVESLSSSDSYEESDDDGMSHLDTRASSVAETIPSPQHTLIKSIAITTSLQISQCFSISLAKEFVNSLNWSKTLFDDSQDRCYCTKCYPISWSDVISGGNAKYVIPRGWTRLGLRVDPIHEDEHDIWNKWIVTFHGTTKTAARSILTHRHFYLPGDKLIDGTILGIRDGHIPNKKFIFTSPTIAYSSSTIYAPNNDFFSSMNNTLDEAQIVLQCRQQPNSFIIQGETIGAGSKRICPHIPNERIEYYTDIRSSIIAYGLLVRFREKRQ
ncbi:unnamed protein product [Rotaria sordida]|uniref:Uncharacterized protein n=1 Tax=Rotaria sordida TaxID=392033 RepID=A0A814EWL7_9BILA|nr:unnamed protein product [Rotaria sordida]